MPDPAINPADFKSLDVLNAGLGRMLQEARDGSQSLDLIVQRPGKGTGARKTPDRIDITAKEGLVGDHWIEPSGYILEDGSSDPDAQICMMMSACIRAIAGGRENWAPAGDNLFLDMDLTPANMPPGTAFAIGSAEFLVTELPHNGCQSFIDRYGRDACLFVNTGAGKVHRLRGIYARVTRDGTVSVGDTVRKL